MRAPGTYLPRVIKAGTYYTRRGKEFLYVRNDKCLVIELRNESYRRIVLSVGRNKEWAEKINKAISKYQ